MHLQVPPGGALEGIALCSGGGVEVFLRRTSSIPFQHVLHAPDGLGCEPLAPLNGGAPQPGERLEFVIWCVGLTLST